MKMKKNTTANKKKKRTAALLVSAVLSLGLQGCGGSGGEKTTAASTEAAVTEASQQSTEQQTTEALTDEFGFYVEDDYVRTTGQTVNVRTEPSTDAVIYLMLEEGVVLHRTGTREDWTRIHYDGTSFYVHSDLLASASRPASGYAAGEGPEEVNTEETELEEHIDVTTSRSLPKVIAIDPANQSTINVDLIEIGPGSEVTKQGATQGSVGTTGVKEFDLNLEYATLLKSELEGRGYTVILTRDTSDIDINNKERAQLAAREGAKALVRIGMNYSDNKELSGVMAVTMRSENDYNEDLYDESYALATRLLQGVASETGCENRGIYETSGMAVINWSTIPVACVDIGFLSNATEESRLVTEEYQRLVIRGLADAIDRYYN